MSRVAGEFAAAFIPCVLWGLGAVACFNQGLRPRTEQAACLLVADQEAEERFDVECPGMLVNECPFADDILAELEERQKECRP